MEIDLQKMPTVVPSSSDLMLKDAQGIQQKLDECIHYTEGIKQCLVYLTQEEADLNSMMLDGELEQNPDLIKFHSQTVSAFAHFEGSGIAANYLSLLKVIKCEKLREVLKETEEEIAELKTILVLFLKQGNFKRQDYDKENLPPN